MDWSGMPPLSSLRAFEATVRTGGFSAAGRELNVTHAAVAQQVRGLERRLGVALLAREGRGLAPTPEGRRLAEALGTGFETMRRALAELAEEEAARPVRISLTPKFLGLWLMPRLGGFRAAHPMVELMLNPSNQVIDLAAAPCDLAIRFGTGPFPGLEAHPLVNAELVIVAAPELLAARPVREAADLARLPWVQERGSDEWRTWLEAKGVPRAAVAGKTDILHLPGPEALEAMRAGYGAGMTVRPFVLRDLAEGRLVTLFDGSAGDGAPTGYHLLHLPGRLRPNVAAFARWIRREAAAGGAAAAG